MTLRPRHPKTPDGELSLRDIDLLEALVDYDEHGTRSKEIWARPMDVGGSSNSHHSCTLGKLVRYGYVETMQRRSLPSTRGSRGYKITLKGLEFVRAHRDRAFGQPHHGH